MRNEDRIIIKLNLNYLNRKYWMLNGRLINLFLKEKEINCVGNLL